VENETKTGLELQNYRQETHQDMRYPNVTFFIHDDIPQNTTITKHLSESRQKFHHGNIRLAVEFENNTE